MKSSKDSGALLLRKSGRLTGPRQGVPERKAPRPDSGPGSALVDDSTSRPLAGPRTLLALSALAVAASVGIGSVALPQYEKAHGDVYRQVQPAPVGDAGVGREFGVTP